jgi:hypothetical protein
VALVGWTANRSAFVQALGLVISATMEKLTTRASNLRANLGNDDDDSSAASFFSAHVQPIHVTAIHRPEHVVYARPLRHSDDGTMVPGDHKVRDGDVPEICFPQRGTRACVSFSRMAFDKLVDHHLDVVEIGFACGPDDQPLTWAWVAFHL